MGGPRETRLRRAGPQSITLRDVASMAGTTPMTVSNVVNGRAGQVGAELRQRVVAACETLGYRPHAGAQLLRTNRHMTIGVMIIDPSPHYLSDPFTAAVLAGLTDILTSHGYALLLHGASSEAFMSAPLMRRIATDGICLILSGAPKARQVLFEQIAALGQPIVLIQDLVPDSTDDACSVIQDDEGGGSQIAHHVLSQRCRQIVMLVPTLAWAAIERRCAGFIAELSREPDPPAFHMLACTDEGFDETQSALATHVLRHGMPDVVVGGNDRMAIAAMKWLTAQGLRIPDDVRVTGFNGLEFWRYANPELTTVRSPAFHLGEESARAMVTRLAAGEFPFRQHVLPVTFMPQRSSVRQDQQGASLPGHFPHQASSKPAVGPEQGS